MNPPTKDTIPGLLLRSIPRELVLGVEDALNAGAARAYTAAKGMDEGHLPHVVGQLRHFNMNEAFYRALAAAEATPTAIQGNGLVTGRTGVFTLARFNIPDQRPPQPDTPPDGVRKQGHRTASAAGVVRSVPAAG
jgi:hypothetical protein